MIDVYSFLFYTVMIVNAVFDYKYQRVPVIALAFILGLALLKTLLFGVPVSSMFYVFLNLLLVSVMVLKGSLAPADAVVVVSSMVFTGAEAVFSSIALSVLIAYIGGWRRLGFLAVYVPLLLFLGLLMEMSR